MFKHFTDHARRATVLAQEEARLLHHGYIGTEHILLGLLREQESNAALVLDSMGVGLEACRSQVEELVGVGNTGSSPKGHIPFSGNGKKVMVMSLQEARSLNDRHIDSEHLLLGLTGVTDSNGCQVLTRLGYDLEAIRTSVYRLIGAGPKAIALKGLYVTFRIDNNLRSSFCVTYEKLADCLGVEPSELLPLYENLKRPEDLEISMRAEQLLEASIWFERACTQTHGLLKLVESHPFNALFQIIDQAINVELKRLSNSS